jgi:hypothetical protein
VTSTPYAIRLDRQAAAGLSQVDSPRAALAGAGLAVTNLRVRDLGGDVARVEVDAGLVPELTDDVLGAVEGFARVTVEPYRSGSMNELLAEPDRYR